MTSEFSKIQALRVTTNQSTKKYENTMMSMPEIAAELNVDFLVDASIQKVDNRIEVKVKLIELKPYEDILWSDVYIKEHRNIHSLYNDLIKDIIEIVEVPLRQSEEINLATATMVDPVSATIFSNSNSSGTGLL